MKTYTASPKRAGGLLRDALQLYHIHTAHVEDDVRNLITYMQTCERRVIEQNGPRFHDLDILVIGPGQKPRETAYFGLENRVLGIDLDVIPQGLNPLAYARMVQQNGPMRAVKTLIRKGLALDARLVRELKKQLGVRRLPEVAYRQMDATRMDFSGPAFDLIYSFSVFEHIPDPGPALDEVRRVLRPGGAAYISLHLFTDDGGCHDLRVFADHPTRPPLWAHLRPRFQNLVQPNAYLNRIRLAEWRWLFESRLPGVHFDYEAHQGERMTTLQQELQNLRSTGELADYTDEELLTVNLIAVWKKPGAEQS